MSQYAVIGLGSFGSVLATELVKSGCEVLAIDKDEARVEAIQDVVQTAVIGDVTVRRTLEALHLDDLDGVIIGLGDNMDASILAALYLKELGVKNVRAKAINSDHAKILQALGVTNIIQPEHDTALRLAKELSHPNVLDYFPLHPEYSVTDMNSPESFAGKSLRELNLGARYTVQVIAVRDKETDQVHMAPDGSYVIRKGDVLVLLGRDHDVARLAGRKEG